MQRVRARAGLPPFCLVSFHAWARWGEHVQRFWAQRGSGLKYETVPVIMAMPRRTVYRFVLRSEKPHRTGQLFFLSTVSSPNGQCLPSTTRKRLIDANLIG